MAAVRDQLRKYLIILSIGGFIGLFLLYESMNFYNRNEYSYLRDTTILTLAKSYESSYDSNKSLRAFSILGEWLRAPEGTAPPSVKKTYRENDAHNDSSSYLMILVWKHGSFLERRHIRGFNANSSGESPWRDCSVKDCRLSYRDEDIFRADAVLFHLHLTKSVREMPSKRGKPGQIWIFMTDESPLHTFLYNYENKISDYDNLFDWSMTYRSDSDVPVAYGRTIMRTTRERSKKSETTASRDRDEKHKLVAIMGSNCSNKNSKRWRYARELKRLLGHRFDIYGRCLDGNVTACPGHFDRDCPLLDAYKFYLAFENSNCREYLTEKIFWNAYEKRSVPIVMGASREDCRRLLPPYSFIHVDDFTGPNELANYLIYLDANNAAYSKYHQWRSRYIVINEHGYFGSASKHYCRICEALRYNVLPAVASGINDKKYRRIENYWNSSRDCNPILYI